MSAGVDYEARVRRMWEAFEREGVSGMLPYIDDDIEWCPTGGAVVRGIAALAEHWEHEVGRRSVVAHAWEQHGECVLVHGSMRVFRDGGFIDSQPTWVYFFRDERMVRAVSFSSREDALRAIGHHQSC